MPFRCESNKTDLGVMTGFVTPRQTPLKLAWYPNPTEAAAVEGIVDPDELHTKAPHLLTPNAMLCLSFNHENLGNYVSIGVSALKMIDAYFS